MRLLFPVVMAFAATASAQPAASPNLGAKPSLIAGSDCPDATSHFAGKGGAWRSKPIKPQKLVELPPADSYAAVYRLDERGCMVPVKFRDIRR